MFARIMARRPCNGWHNILWMCGWCGRELGSMSVAPCAPCVSPWLTRYPTSLPPTRSKCISVQGPQGPWSPISQKLSCSVCGGGGGAEGLTTPDHSSGPTGQLCAHQKSCRSPPRPMQGRGQASTCTLQPKGSTRSAGKNCSLQGCVHLYGVKREAGEGHRQLSGLDGTNTKLPASGQKMSG
jgi:hypothetical protein